MAKKDIKFTLDTIDSNYSPVGTVKQLDSVFFYIKITENGVTKDLTGQTIKLFAVKGDKKLVEQTTKINTTNETEGLVEIELLNSAIQVPGFTYFELEISDNTGIISTSDFILRVDRKVGSDEAIESTNEVATLKEIEVYVTQAKQEIKEFKKLQNEMLKTNETININEKTRETAENERIKAELEREQIIKEVSTKIVSVENSKFDKIEKEGNSIKFYANEEEKYNINVLDEGSVDTVKLKDNGVTLQKFKKDIQQGFRYKTNFEGKEISNISNALKGYSGSFYVNLKCFASNDGFVKSINLFATDIGNVIFFIGSVIDTTFTPREKFSVNVQKKGFNELEVNKYIKEGEFLGVWYEQGSILGYSSEEGLEVGSYLYKTTSTDNFESLICSKANRWLYYNFKLKTIQQPLTTVGTSELEDGAITIPKVDNELLKGFKLESTLIGKDISINKPENKTISSSFYLNKNAISPKDGFLDTINFYASSQQGEIQFCIGSYTQNIFTPRIWLEPIIVTNKGINTHKLDRKIYITEGECIGVFVKSGSPLMFSQSGEDIYYYKGNVTDTFNSLSLLNSTAWIFYNYKLESISNYDKDIESILANISNLNVATQNISERVTTVEATLDKIQTSKPQVDKVNKTSFTIMEEILDFSNVSEWDNVGFQLGESLVGRNGSILTNKKLYGIDNRIIRVELSFADNTSIAEVGSIPNASNLPYVGTSIRLDATDNTLKLMRYSTSSERSDHVVERRELGFSLLNHNIYLEIEKNGRRMDFRVGQVDGTGLHETFYINTIESGNYYPIGTLQGFPYLATIAGEVSYTYFLHAAKCKKKPLLYIIGDSITEGYRVQDDLRWTTLLKNTYGEYEVCVSGIEENQVRNN